MEIEEIKYRVESTENSNDEGNFVGIVWVFDADTGKKICSFHGRNKDEAELNAYQALKLLEHSGSISVGMPESIMNEFNERFFEEN